MLGSSGFVERDDHEAATPADFDDDGQKLWIDGTIVGVVRVPGYFDLVIETI